MSDRRRVVCPGCSCLCDGLTVAADSKIPVEVESCSVGAVWFAGRSEPTESSTSYVGEIRELLSKANSPLITGIENLTTEAQQLALRVADRFYCGIDSGWSNTCRGSMASLQRYGKVTATLGEISNRSDLVMLWFCDPMKTHPRFIERFIRKSVDQKKRLIVIDESKTATAEIADEFIHVSAVDAIEFAQQLRMSIDDADNKSDLAAELIAAKYGSVFVGKPNNTEADFDVVTDQWFQLVRSLNDHTRFVMGALRNDRNGIGANNVLTSLCGFPNAVRFTKDGPLHNGLEYSTESVIRRRECDLLIVCDAGSFEPFESRLDVDTIAWLKTIPVIVLSDFTANKYQTATLQISAETPGWTTAGDFVRLDNVPIPMSALSGVEMRTVQDLLEDLLVA